MARKIKRNARRAAANPRRHRRVRRVARRVVRRHRRRNPVVVVTKRRNYRRRAGSHHRRYHRRRNPAAFGQSGKNLILMAGGVLVGVAATKYLPTLVPSSITGMFGVSPVVSTLITVAGAFAAQFIAQKVMGHGAFSDAVLLGGLALAGSRALDSFAPPQLSQALALNGVGDIVPGYFPVPQNSVTSRAPSPAVMVASKGVGRAFGGGFGRR